MNRTLNFQIFRYHLNPLSNYSQQTHLFPEESKSYKELKDRKNEFFDKILQGSNLYKDQSNPLKLEHFQDRFYLIKLAQKKSTIISRDFEQNKVFHEPFVYIILNNNPNVQKIAISENVDAFSKPTVVKNFLVKLFNKYLEKYGLGVAIEELFQKESFWKFVEKNKYKITLIDFKYIRPNLANISKSLPEDFKNFANNVNSKESHIVIKAPENGILENINKENPTVNGLVDYTSEGAGDIKLKIQGLRKRYSTQENPIFIQINEVQIEGTPDEVIKVCKSIISE